MYKLGSFPIAAIVLLIGCATVPTGPSVMVLPGGGKTFERFRYDDAVCRQWALQQTGTTTRQAATEATVGTAAVGTAVGAATGAAIGAASGNPGEGAAVGSGVGLLGGVVAGASRGTHAAWSVQQRYDAAYMQCMYANGNQIPVAAPAFAGQRPSPPLPRIANIPPPPPGNPPPPPPGY